MTLTKDEKRLLNLMAKLEVKKIPYGLMYNPDDDSFTGMITMAHGDRLYKAGAVSDRPGKALRNTWSLYRNAVGDDS